MMKAAMSVSRPHSLNLCVVTQQIGSVISGIGLHARNLVKQLCADGHRVTVIAPVDQRPEGEPGYRFIGVPPAWPGQNQARWFSLSLSFARVLNRLQHQGRVNNPNVQVMNPILLQDNPHFQVIYHQDRVWIFKVKP